MGTCLESGIKVVGNAGGLAPRACAGAVAGVADRLGLTPTIAYIEGDDLVDRFDDLRAAGVDFAHLDTGAPLGDRQIMTANAYLGGWGIAGALDRGADIVITGRVTDAALAVGPAAWHHGWSRTDWDALAGAVVAGHIIECGAQATGGNYAFFTEVPDLRHPGFPIAEVAADGSSVITKHEGHGGLVSVGTVTAQLLYEIGAPAYANPDVTARFDSIHLEQVGPDRVAVTGVRGDSPPPTTKVAVNYVGGYRSTTTMLLTGLDIEAKAAVFEQALWDSFPGGREAFAETEVSLLRTDHADPASNEAAMAQLRITIKDPDERKVGRAFSSHITELGLANYPGLCAGPGSSGSYGVYWPAIVPADVVYQEVVVGNRRTVVDPVLPPEPPHVARVPSPPVAAAGDGPTERLPLGRLFGARSGDKGGNANLGVWARSDRAYAWLAATLTVDRLHQLLPDTAALAVTRHDLPNLRALIFVFEGLLGEGVAASSRSDPHDK
ncbi:MAG: acyclic terpene utilization AtuA family protein, partial [Actinomycetes bacterium]